jgi:hypothetical protein
MIPKPKRTQAALDLSVRKDDSHKRLRRLGRSARPSVSAETSGSSDSEDNNPGQAKLLADGKTVSRDENGNLFDPKARRRTRRNLLQRINS